jgi:hypothetical protein
MKSHVYGEAKELEANKAKAVKNFYDQRTEFLKPIFIKLQEFKNGAKLYLLN